MGKLYRISSTLMATYFILSAIQQFNDPEWYLWIIVYAGAAYIKLVSCWAFLPLTGLKTLNKATFCVAAYLMSQAYLGSSFDDIVGFLWASVGVWSMDKRGPVTPKEGREKIGGGLVILSLKLQSDAAKLFQQNPLRRKYMEVGPEIPLGMTLLVAIGYGMALMINNKTV